MGFTIPNQPDASVIDQAEPDSGDFAILAAAHASTAVVSGCAVAAQGVPDMTVAVAAGVVQVAASRAAVAAGNVTITAANATFARFDLIVADNTGAKSAAAGVASSNPAFPAIPANSVVLAAVYVPAGATSITAARIVDKRVLTAALQSGQALGGPTRYAAGGWYGLFPPGYPEQTRYTSGQAAYTPFWSWGLTIDQIAVRVSVAGSAGALLRLGIYKNAATDRDMPYALLIDAGTVAADTAGVKTITLGANQRIPDGLNWACIVQQGAPTTEPYWHACSFIHPAISGTGSAPNPGALGAMRSTGGDVTGALPATAIVTALDFQSPAVMGRAV